MTVYCDDMYLYPMGEHRGMKMSHLVADTEEELHKMAERIGVSRRWFQVKPAGNHYDIAVSKRLLALRHGAVPVTMRTLALMCSNRRHTGELGDPATAYDVWRELKRASRPGFVGTMEVP